MVMGVDTEFRTEKDLCACFIEIIKRRPDLKQPRNEWVVYPETGGFDILLVRKSDGFQIGIEAKLRLNAKVVAQSLPDKYDHGVGPDFRAILVPHKSANADLKAICDYIGVTIITLDLIKLNPVVYDFMTARGEPIPGPKYRVSPDLPDEDRKLSYLGMDRWHDWCPIHRITLPDYVPDCDAGCPSPLRLTDWKIRAIKIAVLLERFGSVTRTDFKDLKIDERRWTQGTGWLRLGDHRGVYLRGEQLPDFKMQHPKNYDEIAACIDDWLPQNRKQTLLVAE
jgi:hypothetical protein